MGKENNNLIICNNFYDAIKSLSDENAGKLFKAIFNYHLTSQYEPQNEIVNFAFLTFKSLIDENKVKYKEKCQKNRESIRKYWESKRTNTNDNERIQTNTNIKEKNIKEYKIKENKIININIPSIEEIENYCKTNAKKISVKDFYDYYSASDWLDSNGLPVNWKQKIVTWALREKQEPQEKKVVHDGLF